MKVNVHFLEQEIDQDGPDGSTTRWYRLTGEDRGTKFIFDKDVYGIVSYGGRDHIIDCDGYPMTEGDRQTIAVRNALEATK